MFKEKRETDKGVLLRENFPGEVIFKWRPEK
jgi:hypothetical protein